MTVNFCGKWIFGSVRLNSKPHVHHSTLKRFSLYCSCTEISLLIYLFNLCVFHITSMSLTFLLGI